MRVRSLQGSLLLVVALGAGCASYTALSPDERGGLERDLTQGPPSYLRLSFNVTPFFGDATKRLLTPYPPDEVILLESPEGKTMSPGRVERILPAGTQVRVDQIEFPTAGVYAGRMLYTPRTQPWVYLTVKSSSGGRETGPYILVLRPGLRSRSDVLAELDQYLLKENPTPRLEGYAPSVRESIAAKRVIPDMPAEAVEAAWGYPLRKDIREEEGIRKEVWTWPGNLRKAFLSDGRVTRTEGEGSNN